MAGLEIQTAPTDEPIETSEAKNFIKLDDSVDERVVRSLVIAARMWAENYTGRALINRTLKLSLDGFEEVDMPLWEGTKVGPDLTLRKRHITLPNPPCVSVTSVTTYDDSDTSTVMSTSDYYVDRARQPAQVVLRNGANWPTALRVSNAVEIVYVAGYGATPAEVPEAIRLAMLQYIAFSYEHRGEFERFPPPTPPASIEALMSPYRIMSLGGEPYSGTRRYW